jgi:uncharacterized hydrophobic protein (TIGR00341 family)
MPVRLIEIVALEGEVDTFVAVAAQHNAIDCRVGMVGADNTRLVRILAPEDGQQRILDALQTGLDKTKPGRIVILPVDVVIPPPEISEVTRRSNQDAPREELYATIERGTVTDRTFLLMIVLSTVVAAIGLFDDNVAVVIAAMVIAPLLGPVIALAFGSALGDRELIGRAAYASLVGIGLSVGGAAIAGLLLPDRYTSAELLARTRIDYDSIALALASGAAGALSLMTRVSSVLVGVMVGVALLPPAATLGYMIGTQQWSLAIGAGELLAANIACVNLSAQVVFLSRGIKPRTWLEQRAAQESTTINLVLWAALLIVLMLTIYARHA